MSVSISFRVTFPVAGEPVIALSNPPASIAVLVFTAGVGGVLIGNILLSAVATGSLLVFTI